MLKGVGHSVEVVAMRELTALGKTGVLTPATIVFWHSTQAKHCLSALLYTFLYTRV